MGAAMRHRRDDFGAAAQAVCFSWVKCGRRVPKPPRESTERSTGGHWRACRTGTPCHSRPGVTPDWCNMSPTNPGNGSEGRHHIAWRRSASAHVVVRGRCECRQRSQQCGPCGKLLCRTNHPVFSTKRRRPRIWAASPLSFQGDGHRREAGSFDAQQPAHQHVPSRALTTACHFGFLASVSVSFRPHMPNLDGVATWL